MDSIEENGNVLIKDYCTSTSVNSVQEVIASLNGRFNELLVQINKTIKTLGDTLELFHKYKKVEDEFTLWLCSIEAKIDFMLQSVLCLDMDDVEV